jgi:PilZ domain
MTLDYEELRRHPRVTVDVEAHVHTSDRRRLSARTRDLSRSGICLVTSEPLAVREQLRVELVLLLGPTTSSEPLTLRARVVWCTAIAGSFQIGAMFDSPSAKEAAFLDMFMRYLDGSILPAGAEMSAFDDGEDLIEEDERPPSPEDKDDPFRR